jgi:hypothetical protein
MHVASLEVEALECRRAPGTASSGRMLVLTSCPAARAAASVRPTLATCGSVNVTIGMAVASYR